MSRQHRTEGAGWRSFRHPAPSWARIVFTCTYKLLGCEEAIGIASAVNIEADQLRIVVETVDNGGADAVGVVNAFPLRMAQWAAQQEAVHQAAVVHIAADDLIREVDPKGRGVGRVGEHELGVVATLEQEAIRRAIRGGHEADDVAIVIDARRDRAARIRGDDGRKFAGRLVQFIGVVDAIGTGIEAHSNALIVDAEQLIDRAFAGVGVLVRREDAVPLDEAEVDARGIDPEADRVTEVVEAGHLRLHRTGEVLIGVVILPVRWLEGVALVRVSGGTAAEVASNLAVVVDTQQLVEGRVSVIVERFERIRCRRLGAAHLQGVRTRSSGNHQYAKRGHRDGHCEPTYRCLKHSFCSPFIKRGGMLCEPQSMAIV